MKKVLILTHFTELKTEVRLSIIPEIIRQEEMETELAFGSSSIA